MSGVIKGSFISKKKKKVRSRPQIWFDIMERIGETGRDYEPIFDALTLREAIREAKKYAIKNHLFNDEIYIQKVYAHGDWNTDKPDTYGRVLKLSTLIKKGV